ncbi:shikimate kinase [Thalassotalea sp. ND16A]|uniref:shikimate kinase n=1 Tax=Thalassotalea sp. ND16A TaxID=1535422 RepID=UPI00051CE367|nr:shikimate kinase [Thalassotalea sp. ND16A]KGJ99303.1 hypothetical protein ND16A_3824 [Thalassotalea sp. ND16A]
MITTRKTLIFGNSGSGKSTLAKQLCQQYSAAHLDLDILAWLPGTPPTRAPIEQSWQKINAFICNNDNWVIEGCYADLLILLSATANEMIYLNLSVEDCISNAKNRAFEPHKYQSKQQQDDNLPMLLEWISDYDMRDDTFSKTAHQQLFENFTGKKSTYNSNMTALDKIKD